MRKIKVLLFVLLLQILFQPVFANLQFPKDHGTHQHARVEWWYFTGHLQSSDVKEQFGFELTFFRLANDTYISHFAITNNQDKKFYFAEKNNTAHLAGAKDNALNVWNGNWSAQMHGDTIALDATSNDYAIHLKLKPAKPLLLQGENGQVQKNKNASPSYYYSLTRLNGNGELSFAGKEYRIHSASVWMDHEFSKNGVDIYTGWNWFGIQLDNQDDIMLYQFKANNPYNFGVIYKANGEIIKLKAKDFEIKNLSTWKSPNNILYPTDWLVSIPKHHYQLKIKPTIPNQAITSALGNYWEGSAKVTGTLNDRSVTGNAYVELTGK